MLISKELHDKNLQKSIIIRKFVHSQTEKRNNRIEKKRKVYAGCNKYLQVIAVVKYIFIMWHNNVRVFFTFVFAGILCSFLSNKAFSFAHEMGTTIQVFEPFIWTFGDAKSILLISILLILLFSDMPILGASAPFYLIRIDRKTWVWGQLVYLTIATLDKYAISEMYKVLKSFASNGCTILISSHYNEDIERLCDTVCIIEDGEMKML